MHEVVTERVKPREKQTPKYWNKWSTKFVRQERGYYTGKSPKQLTSTEELTPMLERGATFQTKLN